MMAQHWVLPSQLQFERMMECVSNEQMIEYVSECC